MAAGTRKVTKNALQQLAAAAAAAAGGEPELAELQEKLSAAKEQLQAAQTENETLVATRKDQQHKLNSRATSNSALQAEIKSVEESNEMFSDTRVADTRVAQKQLCQEAEKTGRGVLDVLAGDRLDLGLEHVEELSRRALPPSERRALIWFQTI